MKGRLYTRKPIEVIAFDEFAANVVALSPEPHCRYEMHGAIFTKENDDLWLMVIGASGHGFERGDVFCCDGVACWIEKQQKFQEMNQLVHQAKPETDPQSLLESMNGIETIALLAYIQDTGLRL